MSAAPNRRRFLTGAAAYAAGASVVTGAAAIASEAKGATAERVTPELARMIAKAWHSQRAIDRHHEKVFLPAKARADAAINRIPHVTIDPGKEWRGNPSFWSTNDTTNLAFFRRLVKAEGRDSVRGDVKRARQVLAADRRRTRAAIQARRASGQSQACEESNALCEANSAAEDAVCDFRARSLADLQAKVAFLSGRGFDIAEVILPMLTADIANIHQEAKA